MAPHTPGRARVLRVSALCRSCSHHELLRFLIARPGVNLNCGDEDGDTPLHVVEDVESCRMLAAGAGRGVPGGGGLSPAGNARGEGRDAIADLLCVCEPGGGQRPAMRCGGEAGNAADGDETAEKSSVAQSGMRGAGVPSASEERRQQQAGACVKTTMYSLPIRLRRTGRLNRNPPEPRRTWLSSSSINRGGSSDGSSERVHGAHRS